MKNANLFGKNDMWKKYKLSQIKDFDDDEGEADMHEERWLEKSRRLQIRRWRKIKHQLA